MRDYYCTSLSKAGYAWHPAEFLFQSGHVAKRFDLQIIDAVAEKLSPYECARRVREPVDLLFGLVGAACPEEDLGFMENIPARVKVVCGENVLPDPVKWLEKHPGIDAAMSDFATADLLALAGGARKAPGMAIRHGDGISAPAPVKASIIDIPRPRHELFNMRAYRMPLQKSLPFAELLTDFGCPHGCTFCNSGTLAYRRRRAEDIAKELDFIKTVGIRQIFLKDMSFGAHAKHARMLLDLLSARGFDWHCYARVDDLHESLIQAMGQSGCHLAQIGAEHVSENILRATGKRYGRARIYEVFRNIRRAGMDGGAHFILGLPGETQETLRDLADFIASFDDAIYISINLYAPRMGSPMAGAAGYVESPHDSTRGSEFGALPRQDLIRARNAMYRGFYMRPGRLARLARKMKPADAARSLGAFRRQLGTRP